MWYAYRDLLEINLEVLVNLIDSNTLWVLPCHIFLFLSRYNIIVHFCLIELSMKWAKSSLNVFLG